MQETENIKNRIEFLKYVVSTLTGALFIAYWKIVLSDSIDLAKMDFSLKAINLGIVFFLVISDILAFFEWHNITKHY